MVIKSRIIMVTTILVMACMVWLLGENRAYKAQYEKQLIKEAELVDKYFDLQADYHALFDEVIRLEDETQILGSIVGELENKIEK